MKKVLIICAGLCVGGVERFAANISLFAPKNEFSIDYLVFEGFGTEYAEEVRKAGAGVITVPSPSGNYLSYLKILGRLIDENRYTVVHSHTQFNSGLNLWVAKRHGVPIRIAHSHTSAHEHKISALKQCYEDAMRRLILASATDFCACGMDAGKWMYGTHPFIVINNGIDTDKFRYREINREAIRKQYNLSADAFVIGHSGTLSELKNQKFLIRLMPEIRKQNENAYLMLLGCGTEEMTQRLKTLANECGVSDRVIFTGSVMNVSEYLSAFDVFAFPSLREGTPLALLEAQANGLPCVINDVIPKDACVTELVRALPLNDTSRWSETLCGVGREMPEHYADIMKSAGYAVEASMARLYALYRRE